VGKRYNTRNCRINVDDEVTMKYAKRPPQVSGGHFDKSRALNLVPWTRVAAKEVKRGVR
jgi:hypothetical protein